MELSKSGSGRFLLLTRCMGGWNWPAESIPKNLVFHTKDKQEEEE